jgi:hypothetical protein
MTIAYLTLTSTALYAACGLAFAVALVTAGIGRLDPAARGASVAFRLLIVPGTVALWPLLAAKWFARR